MPEDSLPDPFRTATGAFLPPAEHCPPRFVEIPGARAKQKLMLWGLLALVLSVFLLTAVLTIADGASAPRDVAFPVLAVGTGFVLAAAIFTLILGPVVLFMRRKQAGARAARPNAAVFLSQRTPELRAALGTIGQERPRLGLMPVVTVGLAGIELWRSPRSGTPGTTLSWADIAYVHPDHFIISNGRRRFPVVTMQVSHNGSGQLVDLPLPIMGRNGLMFANAIYANQLLGAFARYTAVV
ncbi:hypothetical protein QO003_003720 [Arthrobacter silviterrae]|uniref:Uncharacterized protein n=1 Tax=Arthrobacter silviterrae TaxID=2026658 RepID=A0ABX0D5U2_9MICC|nr:hypothetical protein [Arthrobacter silviterrae]MDQ0279417.1 hypothetical protein [Arthrobacter silviterrae]NGN82103.1 hypothetical protein [Arthrobacter silviterrae]